jgi:HME family heavy-metal exporter
MALLGLWAFGLTINVMTLGGLAVAIGALVDDAIIDVENVFRRLRENMLRPNDKRRAFIQVIFDASNEIRGTIFFATVIIVLVFVPLLFLQGLEGRFFRPLGLAYIISIVSSLFIALTVTPAMCRYLMKGRLGRPEKESFFVVWLKRHYKRVLEWDLSRRKEVLMGAGSVTILSLLLVTSFGTSFMPKFNEGTYTVFLWCPPGTSLEESDRLASHVEKRLMEVPGVRHVVRRTGRAERDEHAEPVSNSEIEILLKDGHDPSEVKARINRILADVPGVSSSIGQPIEHRLSHIMSGTPAAIAINVFGQELDRLRHVAKEIEKELKKVPGAVDVAANRELMIKTIPIRYRHQELARWGLTPASAAEQVSTAFHGHVAAEINQGVRRYDMVVRLHPDERQNVKDVRGLLLRGVDDKMVRLSEVAEIGPEMASNLIARENSQRKAVVSCNVAEGDNLGHLVERVQKVVDPIVSKYGLSVQYGGQFEARESAAKMITSLSLVVLAVILLLLYLTLRSWASALLVMLNLPLGMIGGILACYFSGSPNIIMNTFALFRLTSTPYQAPVISIAGLVGFVTLFGIAVRNGLLLVNHYLHLIRDEQMPVEKAVVQGAMERLVPILMTAMTAVLGLIPLALSAGEPGSELLAPMAIVVLGGLMSSTVLNLLVVPAGFKLVFSHFPIEECAEEDSTECLIT